MTEQLEPFAGSQTSKAQEKRRLSNRQLEEVKVECQEPLNAVTGQDSTVSEDRMGPGTRIPATSVERKCSHFFSRQAACPKQVMTQAFKEKGWLHEKVDLPDPETVCRQTTSESMIELGEPLE